MAPPKPYTVMGNAYFFFQATRRGVREKEGECLTTLPFPSILKEFVHLSLMHNRRRGTVRLCYTRWCVSSSWHDASYKKVLHVCQVNESASLESSNETLKEQPQRDTEQGA